MMRAPSFKLGISSLPKTKIAAVLSFCAMSAVGSGCASAGKKSNAEDSQQRVESQLQEMKEMLLKMSSKLDTFDEKFATLHDKMNQSSVALEALNKKESRLKQLAIGTHGDGHSPMPKTPKTSAVKGHPTHGQGEHVMAHVAADDPAGGIVDNEIVQAYRRAKILFDAGKLSEAILEFSAFVSDSADHPLAAQAQFYIGESYYRQNEYRLASEELKRVLVSYENSSAVPDALKRLTQSQEKLGLTKDAAKTRQTLLTLYPNSPASKAITMASKSTGTEETERTARKPASSDADLPPATDVVPHAKTPTKPPVASLKGQPEAVEDHSSKHAGDEE